MTTVYLIRHGVTDSNMNQRIQGSTDISLNDQGLAQADLLVQRFRDVPLDGIYSSPLTRARQTAKAICLAKNLSVTLVEGLVELNCGLFEGKTYAENQELFPEQMNYFKNDFAKFAPPGGESALQVYWRMIAAMQAIVAGNEGKTLAVVSHGLAMQTYMGFLLGVPADALVCYPIENTSVTTIHYEDTIQGRILSFNDVSHLSDKH